MGVVLDKKEIIYLRPTKTANTTISMELIHGPDKGLSLTPVGGTGNQTWKEVKNKVTLHQWNNYTIVASIRNPWDQMYDVWASGLSHLSFYDFVMTEEAKKKTQGYYLFDKHKCQADKVIRFENLYEDAKNILGITITSHHNPSPKVDYRDYYNRSTREYVAWLCNKEIKEFGYEY